MTGFSNAQKRPQMISNRPSRAEAEAAFRVLKSDLAIRPIWHHKEGRIKAHILVCFIAYALWKTLQQW